MSKLYFFVLNYAGDKRNGGKSSPNSCFVPQDIQHLLAKFVSHLNRLDVSAVCVCVCGRKCRAHIHYTFYKSYKIQQII